MMSILFLAFDDKKNRLGYGKGFYDKYLNNLIRMSIVDTRLLFLLSRMDYQMMMYEWDGVTKDEINYFEEVVKKYKEIAEQITVEVFVPEIDYSERDTLKFGKLILPDSVQGFDYMQASFGGRPPIGMKKIKISNPEYGCLKDDMPEEEDFTDIISDIMIILKCEWQQKFKDWIFIANEQIIDSEARSNQSFELQSIDVFKLILEWRCFQEFDDPQFILPIGDRFFPPLFPARREKIRDHLTNRNAETNGIPDQPALTWFVSPSQHPCCEISYFRGV